MLKHAAVALALLLASAGAGFADDTAPTPPADCGRMAVASDGTVSAPASIDPARLSIAREVAYEFALNSLSIMLERKMNGLIEQIAANPRNAPFGAQKRARVTQKLQAMAVEMRRNMGEVYSAGFACAMTQPQLQATLDFFHTAAGKKFSEGILKVFESHEAADPGTPASALPFDTSVFTPDEESAMRDFMQSDAGEAFAAACNKQGVSSQWTDAELERVRPFVTRHLAAETDAFMKKEGVAP